jgi:uncharacterized protein YifE (UPF0438 family)
MNQNNIRMGTKLFTDVKRFPYGFKKSGDLSIAEANILSELGHTLQCLELGTFGPESEEEEHFVQVFKGFASPETTVERAWAKYIRLSNTRRNFFSLHSPSFNVDIPNEDSEEFEKVM